MRKFLQFEAVVAPLPLANVDTDQILPARFLKTLRRSGLGQHLFADLRFDSDGAERPDFVLNQPAYRDAGILVAHDNFGSGSSREHAPWALADFGIRCIIAPSFADIFHGNCFKNGILPITLPRAQCDILINAACAHPAMIAHIDLPGQIVTTPVTGPISFDIDGFSKTMLMNGEDEIDLTLRHAAAIAQFQNRYLAERDWLAGVTPT
ncbi:MAG: 3-isopropylmalate dehydratase small subunit [Proteobacteria bacterium]|nr:3-isopropylmalate dehydratase small subunit [Pseudomonadota bacterium]